MLNTKINGRKTIAVTADRTNISSQALSIAGKKYPAVQATPKIINPLKVF